MKHISEVLKADLSAQSSESVATPKRQVSDDPVMWRLWQRMTEIYGHRWTSSFGDEPNESWCRCFSGVAPEAIGAGLNSLLDREDNWPPTAIEFRNLCAGHDDQAWERQCHRIVDLSSLLSHKRTPEQTEAALEHIANLKKMLTQ